ncbi:hypothetical protein AO371_0781 [Moraxella catarrhalis]|uniref:hypothetical protein n=1 Tax=Moraxella catarrhalis TaxID=480 RepID=UPI0007E3C88F|nr:hypothetical protein [Moraxella catarrhalis]OAV24920.1 hypothetical protein AO371_0781 [Moraxella catarrhalis]
MNMIYQEPKLISIDIVRIFLLEKDINNAIKGIISLSIYGENRKDIYHFIKNTLLSSDNKDIKIACIKSIGNIVRIDNFIDEELLGFLEFLRKEEYYQGVLSDLYDDIDIFINCKIN